jgi:hypothetical protein
MTIFGYALPEVKKAAIAAVGFYVAVPANTEQVVGMLVTGIVMAFGVYWTRNAGQGATATPRGP